MKTEKLYYEDCSLQEMDATVLSCEPGTKGWQVILDRTVFFPEGGGQACDLGTLNDVPVTFVKEQEDAVVHLCEAPLPVGETVHGKLQWQRRLDQMQQHSGEHIVSGLICRHFGYHNVGFHVGADLVTIDFDGPVSMEDLTQIEKEANEAIWQNLPVQCGYPSREELPQIPYRSKKELPWPVRIVEVPGYDICACCGVHVAQTGQIGLIKLFSCVKFHQGVRIEMACGSRALSLLSRVYDQNRLVSQAFSAKILETGAAAQKMNEALAAEKFRATGLERQLFDRIAKDYSGEGDVLYFAEDLTPGSLRELADRIAQSCGGTAAVFCGSDINGYNTCLVSKTDDLKELSKQLNVALSGRGGGKPGFFQGSVQATREQIEKFFQT